MKCLFFQVLVYVHPRIAHRIADRIAVHIADRIAVHIAVRIAVRIADRIAMTNHIAHFETLAVVVVSSIAADTCAIDLLRTYPQPEHQQPPLYRKASLFLSIDSNQMTHML